VESELLVSLGNGLLIREIFESLEEVDMRADLRYSLFIFYIYSF